MAYPPLQVLANQRSQLKPAWPHPSRGQSINMWPPTRQQPVIGQSQLCLQQLTPSLQAVLLGTASIALGSHSSACNKRTALRRVFPASNLQGKHRPVTRFLPARPYSNSARPHYKEDQRDCQEEEDWAHCSTIAGLPRGRLAATEGISVSAHWIRRASLRVHAYNSSEHLL
jgi:hypothetical protein